MTENAIATEIGRLINVNGTLIKEGITRIVNGLEDS
jgi:hypothetical protein